MRVGVLLLALGLLLGCTKTDKLDEQSLDVQIPVIKGDIKGLPSSCIKNLNSVSCQNYCGGEASDVVSNCEKICQKYPASFGCDSYCTSSSASSSTCAQVCQKTPNTSACSSYCNGSFGATANAKTVRKICKAVCTKSPGSSGCTTFCVTRHPQHGTLDADWTEGCNNACTNGPGSEACAQYCQQGIPGTESVCDTCETAPTGQSCGQYCYAKGSSPEGQSKCKKVCKNHPTSDACGSFCGKHGGSAGLETCSDVCQAKNAPSFCNDFCTNFGGNAAADACSDMCTKNAHSQGCEGFCENHGTSSKGKTTCNSVCAVKANYNAAACQQFCGNYGAQHGCSTCNEICKKKPSSTACANFCYNSGQFGLIPPNCSQACTNNCDGWTNYNAAAYNGNAPVKPDTCYETNSAVCSSSSNCGL